MPSALQLSRMAMRASRVASVTATFAHLRPARPRGATAIESATEVVGSGARRTDAEVARAEEVLDVEAEEEAVEERLELLPLGELVRGAEEGDERHLDRRPVVVEHPLVHRR